PQTPIIRRLLSQSEPWTDFHQYLLLETPLQVDAAAMLLALQSLLDHHDALRLRIENEILEIGAAGTIRAEDCFRRIPFTGPAALEQALLDAKTRLAPSAGALVQTVWGDAGPSA